jgi:hypothetical protein
VRFLRPIGSTRLGARFLGEIKKTPPYPKIPKTPKKVKKGVFLDIRGGGSICDYIWH